MHHHCPTCGRPTDPAARITPPCAPLSTFERDRLDGKGSHARGLERLLTEMGGDNALPLAAIGPAGIRHPDTHRIHE